MFVDPKVQIQYIKLDWDSCKQLFLLIGHCWYHDPLIKNVVKKIQFFERLCDFLISILPNYCLKMKIFGIFVTYFYNKISFSEPFSQILRGGLENPYIEDFNFCRI